MSDDAGTAAADAQAAADAAAQAQAAAADDAQDGAGDASTTLSPEDARKLRSEARSLRQRLKDAEEKANQLESAQLSDVQKLDREKTALVAERDGLQTENRNLRAQIAAAQVGIRAEAVGDAVKLLDWDEIEDPSNPKQVEKALKELVKEKPYLSGRPEGLDGGAGRKTGETTSMNDVIRQAAGRS